MKTLNLAKEPVYDYVAHSVHDRAVIAQSV
jgi:hypothetical protein